MIILHAQVYELRLTIDHRCDSKGSKINTLNINGHEKKRNTVAGNQLKNPLYSFYTCMWNVEHDILLQCKNG